MPKPPTNEDLVSQAASAMARKGGKAGTGKAKRRDPAHYRHKLVEARLAAKLRRTIEDA